MIWLGQLGLLSDKFSFNYYSKTCQNIFSNENLTKIPKILSDSPKVMAE